jgi:hypothetical protein
MDAENVFSRGGTMKGLAVELPFFKFKYLKIEGNASEQTSQSRIDTVVDKQLEQKPLARTKIEFVQTPQITTLGVDPMVSSASVIHELAYGRIGNAPALKRPDSSYNLKTDNGPSQLNFLV